MKHAALRIASSIGIFCASAAWADDARIDIKNHTFIPATIIITAGSKVTWTNRDQDPHTVADSDKQKRFRSAALDTNESYSFTFSVPGTYQYFCTLHPDMVGTVAVSKP